MSWNFTVDDLRNEVKELREKLAVQAVKVGEQETKIIRNEEELHISKENYADALTKLRKEADRSLELEEALKRRTEELRNEKNVRENVEEALRFAKEGRQREAESAREAQHYLNRAAVESNDYREQREKLAVEKAKLESQVRELQGELQRHQVAPPPPSKTPARPRASSLTNLNKVAMLERDLEQLRASASSSELDLRSTHEKLSRAQSDLVRSENEKAVLEKKLKEHEKKAKDILSEKEDLQAELEFYRDQAGLRTREDELLARLEEEEAKVALLEKQLTQASTSTHNRRAVDQLQTRLSNEISRREDLENREAQLVRDREEAFNEIDDLKRTSEQLEHAIAQKDLRISEYESQCRALQQLLNTAGTATPSSSTVADKQIADMVNLIERLRAERDELKAHLEFVQMESHFKVEALEGKLAIQTTANASADAQLEEYQSQYDELDQRLNNERRSARGLRVALQAMVITIQHIDTQHEHAEVNARNVNRVILEHQSALWAKEEEVGDLRLRLSDTTLALQKERDSRSALDEQVQQLEVDLDMAKQELSDSKEHCERLEARQSSEASHDTLVRSLKNEIEELRNRVMRRTEQIGLQQHDIKRLETNMRLTDERLEEALGELELAETAKAAMLEDCSVAREERDLTKKSIVQAELEVERLSARVQELEKETHELRSKLISIQEKVADSGKLSAMIETVAERDSRIGTLEDKLEASEASLRTARKQVDRLTGELEELRESSRRSVEGLRNSSEAASEELDRRARELCDLTEEVKAAKLALEEAQRALQTKTEEYSRASTVIETLASKLADAEARIMDAAQAVRSSQDDREAEHALAAKEEELRASFSEVQRLTSELETVKVCRDEALRSLHSKEIELEATSAASKRLLQDLEARDADRARLDEMNVTVSRLEAERTDLANRLAAFESEAEKELSDSMSLRSVLEDERKRHEEQIKKLESTLASLEADKEMQKNASESIERELKVRHNAALELLEATKAEVAEKHELCDALANEQKEMSSGREDEVANLKQQVADLTSELEILQHSLHDEIDNRTRIAEVHKGEIEAALEKQEGLAKVESELRESVEGYKRQLTELRSNLMTLQDENTALQSEFDDLSGECRRATLKSQALEAQLASSSKELSELRNDISRLREALSQSEKSGKTAEMNLLLISQQHERTIASLRNQLKEHEKGAERIQKLQQIVGETREQISEMEGLLKAKCAEIEENDDKFIQLLKEKKKLTSKVESLTKKNNALQKKLSTPPTEGPIEPSAPETSSKRRSTTSNVTRATTTITPVAVPAEMPVFSSSKAKTPEIEQVPHFENPRETRRVSGPKRRRESTPPREEIPASTSIGKKRPLPEDSDSGCAPVEARFPDAFRASSRNSPPFPSSSSSSQMPLVAEFSSTPRTRRMATRSGFTPVRGQSTALRPTLSQPSPIKRSRAAQALQSATVISDVTNSPPRSKRLFTTEPGSAEPRIERPAAKGWLGKIRGGNPLLRTRQQSNGDARS